MRKETATIIQRDGRRENFACDFSRELDGKKRVGLSEEV
jgi:hypothetical protein